MKSVLRTLTAAALHLAGMTRWARNVRRASLAILCYHRVLPTLERNAYILPALAVTPDALDAHAAIAARYYTCLPLREAAAALQQGWTGAKPLLAFTFDDGYADNAIHAAPILEDHGIRATFFAVSSLVGTNQRTWYDLLGRIIQRCADQPIPELAHQPDNVDAAGIWIAERFRHRHGFNIGRILSEAKQLSHQLRMEVIARLQTAAKSLDWLDDDNDRLMSHDDLKRLTAAGHEVASHTQTHPLLPQLSDAELTSELAGSKGMIESTTGAKVHSLAYPNGDHDERVVRAAQSAGYRLAVTTLPGTNHRNADPMRMRRIFVSQDRLSRGDGSCASSLFELELTGLADRVFFRRRGEAMPA